MKIAFLYPSQIIPTEGGVQRVTSVLADAFERDGNVVHYISLQKNVNNERRHTRQIFLPDNNQIDSRTNADFLRKTIKEFEINILINQDGLNPATSHLAGQCKKAGIKLISVIHNSPLSSVLNYRHSAYGRYKRYWMHWLLPLIELRMAKILMLSLYRIKYEAHVRELCSRSDHVVVLSEKFKPELNFFLHGATFPNVVAIPNPNSFSGCVGDLTKKKELLYVGRIDFSQKRVDLLLRIWAMLAKDFPEWSLKILGDGPDMPVARELAAKLDLTNVDFLGFRDPCQYYRSASIFCMTSTFEGFPMALVEASNFGCVPVAFNSFAAVSDVIDDGENGVLVPPFDLSAYARTLASLMRDDCSRIRFALSTQKKSDRFSIEVITKLWYDLLKSPCCTVDEK